MRKPAFCICKNKCADQLQVLWIWKFSHDFYFAIFFHFQIFREFLNSRASIRVVGHFRGLKVGALCISCER